MAQYPCNNIDNKEFGPRTSRVEGITNSIDIKYCAANVLCHKTPKATDLEHLTA